MFFFYTRENQTFKPNSIEHAYCCILDDDLKTARLIFAQNDSPRGCWGTSLVDILMGYIENLPSFFQIRNFLEIDMDFLLKNGKIDYVEQLLGGIDLLCSINQESYKYVARVMFENKHYNAAKQYLEKAKACCYNDPELHFLLAKYHINIKDYKLAKYYIDECVKILPDYYPARILSLELNEILNKLM